jgi:hypothetical protein
MAEVAEGKLMLSAVPDDEREAARTRLLETLRGSRFVGPGLELDDDELMQEAVDAIKEARRKQRGRRAFAIEELSLEDAAEIAKARVPAEYAHLDALLEG